MLYVKCKTLKACKLKYYRPLPNTQSVLCPTWMSFNKTRVGVRIQGSNHDNQVQAVAAASRGPKKLHAYILAPGQDSTMAFFLN